MASFQIHLDSKFADLAFDKNACLWHLADPLYLPSDKYEFLVNVSAATIPLSHHVITAENNLLQLQFPTGTTDIRIPAGNRTIDEVIAYLNMELEGKGFACEYDEATNRISISTEALGTYVSVGTGTTSQRLLGFAPGQTGSLSITAERGVDLSGTSSIFVRSNLLTRNRDPVTKAVSNILAKVHVSCNFYEIEYFSSRQQFSISDRAVTMIVVYLTDDAQQQIDMNKTDYSVSLEFAVREKPVITHARDYKLSGITTTTNVPQPLQDPAQAPEPADEEGDSGGPVGGAG